MNYSVNLIIIIISSNYIIEFPIKNGISKKSKYGKPKNQKSYVNLYGFTEFMVQSVIFLMKGSK
ncbi:MAG TPA: hypothetical protein DIW32_05940 [Eubacterium sp.]|nr:hypothetical protein [Eubacterium sp.]